MSVAVEVRGALIVEESFSVSGTRRGWMYPSLSANRSILDIGSALGLCASAGRRQIPRRKRCVNSFHLRCSFSYDRLSVSPRAPATAMSMITIMDLVIVIVMGPMTTPTWMGRLSHDELECSHNNNGLAKEILVLHAEMNVGPIM